MLPGRRQVPRSHAGAAPTGTLQASWHDWLLPADIHGPDQARGPLLAAITFTTRPPVAARPCSFDRAPPSACSRPRGVRHGHHMRQAAHDGGAPQAPEPHWSHGARAAPVGPPRGGRTQRSARRPVVTGAGLKPGAGGAGCGGRAAGAEWRQDRERSRKPGLSAPAPASQ